MNAGRSVVLDQERRDRLTGIGLAVLGVIVLAMAILALRHPGTAASSGLHTTPAARLSTTTHANAQSHSAPPASSSSSSSSSAPVPSSSSFSSGGSGVDATSAAAKHFQLIVLNNTSTAGLAAGAEARFEAAGWTVSHIDTLHQNIVSTCAYYDPAQAGAKEAAQELQSEFPVIKRVAPRFTQLPAGPIVVVLAWDYHA